MWIVTLRNRSSRPVGTIYIGGTGGTVRRTEGMFAGATMEDVEGDYDETDGPGVLRNAKRSISTVSTEHRKKPAECSKK